MKNVYIFYFDGFWAYEVGVSLNVLRNENITAVALENRVYISEGKQKFLPDKTIDELNPDEIDLFIIPGGSTVHLFENEKLKKFLYELNSRGKFIAGVCGGTALMVKYGLLENRKVATDVTSSYKYYHMFENTRMINADFMVDGNLITAPGEGFLELGIELGRIMGVYKDDEEALEDYRWLKNIKPEHLEKLGIKK